MLFTSYKFAVFVVVAFCLSQTTVDDALANLQG
jgi:hypothetical protein